jgi:hypothetical protein
MPKQLQSLGWLAGTLVMAVCPVIAVVVTWNGGPVSGVWRVVGGVYLLVVLVTGVLSTRRWFRERARERIATEEFAQFLAEKRAAR